MMALANLDSEHTRPKATKKAYTPFEIEFREFLVSEHDNEVSLKAVRLFMIFHAYRPSRRGRRLPTDQPGRFSSKEYHEVRDKVHAKQQATGQLLPSLDDPDFSCNGRTQIDKTRSALLNAVAAIAAPEVTAAIKADKFIKNLGANAAKMKAAVAIRQCKEKTDDTHFLYQGKQLVNRVEQAIWESSIGKTSKTALCAHLRNRAAFLSTVQTCCRNDSLLNACLSDMSYMVDIGSENGQEPTPIGILTIVSPSKVDGIVSPEPQRSTRHRDPELCSVGAYAFYLFLRFDIHREWESWDFTNNPTWFHSRLFCAAGDTSTEFNPFKLMGPDSLYDFMKKMLKLAGAWSNHYQHFGRHYGPVILELMGCLLDAIQSHGGWDKKTMDKFYLANIPILAIVMAAWFPGEKGLHWSPREMIDDFPPTLAAKVFPFIEMGYAQLSGMPDSQDKLTAHKFLSCMVHMRKVFLQDAAWFNKHRPNHAFLRCHFWSSWNGLNTTMKD